MLKTDICGVEFRNPLMLAAGIMGSNASSMNWILKSGAGGVVTKSFSLNPHPGYPNPTTVAVEGGILNAIGLSNPGVDNFKEELKRIERKNNVVIASIYGATPDEFSSLVSDVQDYVDMIELNISCPNVSAGGAAFGMTCSAAGDVVRAVRAATSKPLVVKLTPQAPDLIGVAMECIKAGAQGISLCNSFQGIAIDIERGVPVFEKVKAGVGGPAVRPIAVRLVYELVEAINKLPENQRVPVIAIGGIASWQDAVEFIMAGAAALEVGTATFVNPLAMVEIVDGLAAFMKRKGYKTLDDFRGCIQK